MRKTAWILLLLFAFTIPWEYSLDLGEPLGNVARITGLLVLLVAIPAVLQAGRIRTPGAFLWCTLALFLWLCCSYFWSIDPAVTLAKIRGYFQEMMIVWLVWEFIDSPADLRNLLRAAVAGSWVLALLTLAAFRSADTITASQIRYAAYGQDPNDVARFLDLGFPFASLLAICDPLRRWRYFAFSFLPLGFVAVVITASRSGFLAAILALGGSAILLARKNARRILISVYAMPPFLAALWLIVPRATFERLATIPEQLRSGDLNQRLNIWSAGWRAFANAPCLGTGAGTFVSSAHLSPIDTAHNTVLSIAVGGGLCVVFLASILVVLAARSVFRTCGSLRWALVTALLVWAVTSLVATAEENRMTWLLFGILAACGRISVEDRIALLDCYRAANAQTSFFGDGAPVVAERSC